jgi:hypothetical protein
MTKLEELAEKHCGMLPPLPHGTSYYFTLDQLAALIKEFAGEPYAFGLEYQTMGGDVSEKLSYTKSGAGVCKRLNGESHETPLYALELDK